MKPYHLFFFVFALLPFRGNTNSCPILSQQGQLYALDSCLSYFVDYKDQFTFEDIQAGAGDDLFKPVDEFNKTIPFSATAWLKAEVTADTSFINHQLILRNHYQDESNDNYLYLTGDAKVAVYYLSTDGEMIQYTTGMNVPLNEKLYPAQPHVNAVPFELAAGQTLIIYLQLSPGIEGNIHLSIEIRPNDFPLLVTTAESRFRLGQNIGVFGILGLLAFLFYLYVGDRANLYFSFFCLCLFLHYLILDPGGSFIRWFIPDQPWLMPYCWFVFTSMNFSFFAFFGRAFTNLNRHSVFLDQILRGVAWSFVGLMLLRMLDWSLHLEVPVLAIFTVLLLTMLGAAIRIGFIPGVLNRIYGAGALFLLLFSVLGFLFNQGVFTWFNPWLWGQIGVAVIYTIGLAYKLQLNERTKAEAERVIELDNIKSRFFANISHELRTPLALIKGPLQIMREQTPVSEEERLEEANENLELPARHLKMMYRNAHRLEQLIEQMLDLSKLENGRMKLAVSSVAAIPFLRAIVFSFESLAERRQIHFQTSFPADDQEVFFDRDKLEKIIVNLLSNAFKYTPEKGRVAVSVLLETERLKISVQDSGPGIPAKEMDKVFERFYRVEGSEEKGSGIGLSLVKELVELHKGQLSLESTQGTGTTFKLSLPVNAAAYSKEEMSRATVAVQKNSDHRIADAWLSEGQVNKREEGSEKSDLPLVLVVEDNQDLRQFMEETLQTNYRVATAENGLLGLDVAIELIPDLVLSDVMMPEMNGLELSKKLKNDDRTSHIPIILLTAKAGQQPRLDGLETGADDYLTKPFDARELRLRIHNLIEQRQRLRTHYSQLARGETPMQLEPMQVKIVSADEVFLQKVAAAIEEKMDDEYFSVEDLASSVAFSRSQLHRKLKALLGKSPNELIREFRLGRAKSLLEQGGGNISEIALAVGYGNVSYFSKSFKDKFGYLPSEVVRD